ncbi:hypothetical protein R6Q59_018210 [Mikania micrantha]
MKLPCLPVDEIGKSKGKYVIIRCTSDRSYCRRDLKMTVPGPPMALQATGLTETKTVVNLQAPNTRARSKETYAKQLIKKKRKLAFESKKNAEKERNIRYGGETNFIPIPQNPKIREERSNSPLRLSPFYPATVVIEKKLPLPYLRQRLRWMAFRDEIELLRHIRHPNVVQFLGA